MKRIFLDTNIVLDFLESKRKNHHLALELIKRLINENYEIFISEDMLSTIYYIANDKFQVLNFFNNLIKKWNKRWHVVSFEEDVIKQAIEYSLENGKDFEDALQCFTAKKYNCILITEDKKFLNCDIKIVDYEKFLLKEKE